MKVETSRQLVELPMTALSPGSRARKTGRTVMCTVRSASYRDIAAAGSDGLRPEIIFRLAQDFEYQDEKIAEFHGKRYNIDRVYFADDSDWIDLTCSRGEPNA